MTEELKKIMIDSHLFVATTEKEWECLEYWKVMRDHGDLCHEQLLVHVEIVKQHENKRLEAFEELVALDPTIFEIKEVKAYYTEDCNECYSYTHYQCIFLEGDGHRDRNIDYNVHLYGSDEKKRSTYKYIVWHYYKTVRLVQAKTVYKRCKEKQEFKLAIQKNEAMREARKVREIEALKKMHPNAESIDDMVVKYPNVTLRYGVKDYDWDLENDEPKFYARITSTYFDSEMTKRVIDLVLEDAEKKVAAHA